MNRLYLRDNEKLQNVRQMPQMAYICTPKVWDLYAKVWFIYYINVRQIVGGEKKYAIVA